MLKSYSELVGAGLSREEATALHGTGFAGVRGQVHSHNELNAVGLSQPGRQ